MKSKYWLISCIFLLLCTQIFAEFLTLTGFAALSAAGGYISYKVRCRFMECCTTDEVPYDMHALRAKLKEKVFGQPLVEDIVPILKAHIENFRNEMRGSKALTISFHGWTGSGKNHVASLIAESLYKRGMNSKFVKLYVGRHHFPNPNLVEEYKMKLISEINAVVSECPTALIIFDEVNECPPGIIDVIKPMTEHYGKLNGIDYSGVVFILISNIGGDEITDQFLKLRKLREDVILADFEKIIREKAITEGGFAGSSVIYSQMIDHYIPFLPLEQKHVEKCAIAEFRDQGRWNPTEEMIEEALSIITYGPPSVELFANAGCKRMKKQVAYVLYKNVK